MVFYCCDSIRRLCKMNYIDCNAKGQAVVYLQNVYVKTNIPYDLRGYKYCIRCGIDTRIHPIIKSNDVNHCNTLGEGLYCGYDYSANSGIENTNFLIQMNYLV